MASFLILWSSTEGQTRRIVQSIEQELRKGRHKLETVNVDAPPRSWIFSKADALLVAASIHRGRYTEGLRKILKQQSGRVAALPSVFVSVSLSAARPETRSEADGYIAALLEETGFKPSRTISLAGALRYPEYSFFKRRMMKSIAGKGGLPTDTSQVHEFTDWERVRAIAGELVELAGAGAGAGAGALPHAGAGPGAPSDGAPAGVGPGGGGATSPSAAGTYPAERRRPRAAALSLPGRRRSGGRDRTPGRRRPARRRACARR